MTGRSAFWVVFICFTMGPEEESKAAEFGWPLGIKPALSSTFGETRTTAFHAGIDLKTWGKTGYEVRSLGDGYVWRLRTSPWGYGRAVYQKLEDGRILVYAHLQGFAPTLARPVEKAQQKTQRYSVDIWFEEGEIPLRAGDLVAWTGKSGAGPPHLHLELRDQDNVPVNPLMHGFEIEDAVAPTLGRIALVPIGAESMVEGRRDPVSVGLPWIWGKDLFESPEILMVYGRIGVSVLAYDRTGAAHNKLAPYRHTLIVDGHPAFSAVYDRIAYPDGHQVYLDRMRLEFPGGSGEFYNLFRLPGNRLGFYDPLAGGDGLLYCGVGNGDAHLGKGLHQLLIESEDAAGNKSQGRLQVLVNAPPVITRARLVEARGALFIEAALEDADDERLEVELARSVQGEKWTAIDRRQVHTSTGIATWPLSGQAALWRLQVWDGAGGESFGVWALPGHSAEPQAPRLAIERRAHPDFVELVLSADQVLAAAPQVQVEDGSQRYALIPRQVGLKDYRVVVPLRAVGARELEVIVRARGREGSQVQEKLRLAQQAVAPDKEARLDFGDGEAVLVFPRNSAYERVFPQAERFQPAASEHLLSTGMGYAFGPDMASFNHKVEIQLRYPEATQYPEKLGLYREGKGGQWQFVDNELDLDRRMVCAKVRRFSRYALLVDEGAPFIGRVQPTPGAVVARGRPRVSAWIEDRGSGIGREEDVVMELDGKHLISEYDPEDHTVHCQVEEDLAPGPHRLVVRVRDMSGNEASASSDFVAE